MLMTDSTIAVIDTGICNLRSVTKAIEAVGGQVAVVHTGKELAEAKAAGLVLPGVGALRDCVASLRRSGLGDAVADWVRADQPFLGVCLGMQALFDFSEEGGSPRPGFVPWLSGAISSIQSSRCLTWAGTRFVFCSQTRRWLADFALKERPFISCIAFTACRWMRISFWRSVIMEGDFALRSRGGGSQPRSSIQRRARLQA
jgi:imidazole glycerol phosphate synthase glutamine amidotransferase subunit